ncbi:MAG: helix-turn-helix transcriptional regulator [Bacteroidota bacterium]
MLRQRPPKSIRFVAGLLNSTDRTVYRYFDLLKAVGFDLQTDDHKRYFIAGMGGDMDGAVFTNEEAVLVKKLLLTGARHNKLRDSILKKLSVRSEVSVQAELLVNARAGTLVEILSGAMASGKQVILRKYHSANSDAISDRLVEPVRFTADYHAVCAYEPASGRNKMFNIERITAVTLTRKPFQFRDRHQWEAADAFGFTAQDSTPVKIDLLLGVKASVMLKEEYPQVSPFLHREGRSNRFRLTMTVNNPRPVIRFVLGMLDNVEVVGSAEFVELFRIEFSKLIKRFQG